MADDTYGVNIELTNHDRVTAGYVRNTQDCFRALVSVQKPRQPRDRRRWLTGGVRLAGCQDFIVPACKQLDLDVPGELPVGGEQQVHRVRLARPGGHIANIGVHGEPVTLHLEELWIRDVTITTGLVDTYTTPTLLRLVLSQQLDPGRFVTHHFTLDQFEEAYDVFARASETGALKVVLTRT
jgi:alcohol dehydrogenase